jgi:PAS domain S-box-containing protein
MTTDNLTDRARKRLEEVDWQPSGEVEDPAGLLYDLELRRVELELQAEQLQVTRERLRRSRERFRALYELASSSLLTLRGEQIVEANSRAVMLLGRHRVELVGKPLTAFVRSRDEEALEGCLQRARHSGEPVECACVFVRPDGPSFRARVMASVITRRDEGDDAIVVSLTDLERELGPVERLAEEVMAHRESRSELDATRSRLAAIVETAVDAIITIDLRGTIEFVNPTTEEIFGYESGELVGKNVRVLMPSPHRERHDHYLARYRAQGGESPIVGAGREVEALHRDGTTFPVHIAVAEMEVEGELKYTGMIRDLTERKELEKQLVQSQRMEAIGTLATGVAHDFNNLIMGVTGCLDLVERKIDPGDPASEHLAEARESLESGAAIASQLLAYARRDEAKHPPCSVDDVVLRVRNVFGPLLGDEIDLETRLDADEFVRADPGQLEQILLNLAINARDAMPDGGTLTIETAVECMGESREVATGSLTAGWYVRVSVGDTGHGIAEDELPQIFEPFFTTKPAGRGTGLGLSMVFGTIQSLGGGVSVESEVGTGTSFSLLIPMYRGDAELARTLSTSEYARVSPARCTALVVEDERLVAQAVRQQLSDRGHDAIVVSSVSDAISVARKRADDIDVVITDSVLSDGFGTDVARGVREFLPEVGTIFMSAHGRDMLLSKGRVHENSEFLQKPFDGDQLQRALVITLGRAAVGEHRDERPDQTKRAGKILIVDDHEATGAALETMLDDEGYDVVWARSVAEACEQSLEQIALLVTDVRLADGTGVDVADAIEACNPGVEIVYCSGLTRQAAMNEHRLPEDAAFLAKPFDLNDLLEIVAEFVQQRPLTPSIDT